MSALAQELARIIIRLARPGRCENCDLKPSTETYRVGCGIGHLVFRVCGPCSTSESLGRKLDALGEEVARREPTIDLKPYLISHEAAAIVFEAKP